MNTTKRSRKFGTFSVLVLACTFGMLIWVKLRVVESVPRQAYAEPKRSQGEHAPAGFKPGKAPESTQLPPEQASGSAQEQQHQTVKAEEHQAGD